MRANGILIDDVNNVWIHTRRMEEKSHSCRHHHQYGGIGIDRYTTHGVVADSRHAARDYNEMMSIACAQELKFRTYVTPLTSQTNLVLRGSLGIRTVSQRPSHLPDLVHKFTEKWRLPHFFPAFYWPFPPICCHVSLQTHAIRQRTILITIEFFLRALLVWYAVRSVRHR